MSLRAELLIRDPAAAGLRLDAGRLDHPATGRLRTPLAGEIVLDMGRLDTERLYPVEPLIWFDLAGYCSAAECTTGNRTDTPSLPADPGTATLALVNAPDLSDLGVTQATRLRLSAPSPDAPAEWVTVWAGWVNDWSTTWGKSTGSRAYTTLTGVDLAARLGNTTRYGAQHAGTETVADRFNRLAQSSPVPVTVTAPAVGALGPTVAEASLLEHVNMAAATGYRFARIDTVADTLDATDAAGSPVAVFTDDESAFPYPDEPIPAGYLDVGLTAGATATVLEVTSRELSGDTTTTVRDPTAVAVRGVRAAAVSVSAPSSVAPAVAAWLLPPYKARPAVSWLRLRGRDAWAPPAGWLRPLDLIRVRRLGSAFDLLAGTITHRWFIRPETTGPAIVHETTITTARKP